MARVASAAVAASGSRRPRGVITSDELARVRPGGTNHKGVLDFWRRKKKSYAVVAARFNASLHGETLALRPTASRVRAASLRQRITDNADPETQC